VENFDPSRYLPGVSCPILFVNGTNDFAYPLDSYRKSYRLVQGPVWRTIRVRMPHGHPQGWAPKEIGIFVDSVLRKGDPLQKIGPMKTTGSKVSASFEAKHPIVRAELSYTTDTGAWQKRGWQTVEAGLHEGTVSAELPADRPVVCFLNIIDRRGALVSTEHIELPRTAKEPPR
jgi:hypothetical protein